MHFRRELLLVEDYLYQTLVLGLESHVEFGEMKKGGHSREGIVTSKQLECIGGEWNRRLARARHRVGRNWKATLRLRSLSKGQ